MLRADKSGLQTEWPFLPERVLRLRRLSELPFAEQGSNSNPSACGLAAASRKSEGRTERERSGECCGKCALCMGAESMNHVFFIFKAFLSKLIDFT